MEFNEKLQELRRQKGLTQEQLAAELFVSRTAVSKWEQGKGYPSLDSLKRISEIFEVTVDELLSSEKVLSIAESESKEKRRRFLDLIFGFLDIAVISLLFLPFFAEKSGASIQSASLLELSSVSAYIKVVYLVLTAVVSLFGVLTLALQGCKAAFWLKIKSSVSLTLSLALTLVFIISLQPYAAVFVLLFLIIKVMTLKVSGG